MVLTDWGRLGHEDRKAPFGERYSRSAGIEICGNKQHALEARAIHSAVRPQRPNELLEGLLFRARPALALHCF